MLQLSPDGRLLLPPTTDLSGLCENLESWSDTDLDLYHVTLTRTTSHATRSRWNSNGDRVDLREITLGTLYGWERMVSHTDDQIACVIRNKSNVKVWPYVLEFAEDGSVTQRVQEGRKDLLPGTREVAKTKLGVSSGNAFQLAESGGLMSQGADIRSVLLRCSSFFLRQNAVSTSPCSYGPRLRPVMMLVDYPVYFVKETNLMRTMFLPGRRLRSRIQYVITMVALLLVRYGRNEQ